MAGFDRGEKKSSVEDKRYGKPPVLNRAGSADKVPGQPRADEGGGRTGFSEGFSKGVDKGSGAEGKQNEGAHAAGHVHQAHERMETHHRHIHEHLTLHRRHEHEHGLRSRGEHPENHSAMNQRHEAEHAEMHKRHQAELKAVHQRHELTGSPGTEEDAGRQSLPLAPQMGGPTVPGAGGQGTPLPGGR